ncbi:MAG: lipopolysaccharide heptosyltransferase I [Candidatus Accumulibacter sp.]|jgi:heptosyltransferase-1|nr:lipopolysaccharide heptosyltransferase I [Accumulibacter sp.]
MRILLIKTSSLGDVIHNLPVASDLRRAFPDAEIDWCVEENFADIPRLHPAVADVIPVAVRRWRKTFLSPVTWREIGAFKRRLQSRDYDAILDTQGLIKSAAIARLARGRRFGYAAEVAREALAARFYDETFVIPPNAHAVTRNRWLASAAFGHPLDLPLDYGIVAPNGGVDCADDAPTCVLFTASSRDEKLLDESSWVAVARALADGECGGEALTPVFPAGTPRERTRAERIACRVPRARVAPPLTLSELAGLLKRARLAVGVDTGLVHLAAALRVPAIAVFIASDPALTGIIGAGFHRNLGVRGHAPTVEDILTAARQALLEDPVWRA